jgi:hypothetical protein
MKLYLRHKHLAFGIVPCCAHRAVNDNRTIANDNARPMIRQGNVLNNAIAVNSVFQRNGMGEAR